MQFIVGHLHGWMAAYAALGFLALVHAIVLTVQTWENRRYVRRNCQIPCHLAEFPRVALVIPVKGVDLELAESLKAFLHQDYPNYEVHFVGEDTNDPAHEVIRQLAAQFPDRPLHWHSAGIAERCGQKVHNLLAATRELEEQVEFVAFADSDARPKSTWLQSLVWRLTRSGPSVGAATGYRCCVPVSAGLANFAVYALNSGVTALLGPKAAHNLLWGGSWAIRRKILDEAVRPAWESALSDDMVASHVIHALDKRITFEPKLLLPSATQMTVPQLMEFLRRQFYMVRHYAPGLWLFLLTAWTVQVLGFWTSLALSVAGAASGAAWTWLPTAVTAVLYGLGVFRATLRQDACRAALPDVQHRLVAAQRVERWSSPLLNLLGWTALLSSTVSRRVVWRNIEYRLGRHGRVESVCHLAPKRKAA